MFDPKQLREFITTVLKEFAAQVNFPSLYSPDAVELLLLTAAQETHLGRYIHQIGGPALGMFQIEWNTYQDLMKNWLRYRDGLDEIVAKWQSPGVRDRLDLMGNLPYQIVIARLIYRRVPKPLPDNRSHTAMAQYWKKYWNTELGKGTVDEAVANYQKYVVEG